MCCVSDLDTAFCNYRSREGFKEGNFIKSSHKGVVGLEMLDLQRSDHRSEALPITKR